MDNESRATVERIIDIAVGTIRNFVRADQSHAVADELRHVCRELLERDLERIRHEHPPPGIAAPPPRGWADAWDLGHHFRVMPELTREPVPVPRRTPATVAESERLVDEVHNRPMTATEVRRRQAEFVEEQQRRLEGLEAQRLAEYIEQAQRRAEAQRRGIAARHAAAVDLAMLGQSQIRMEPGQVQRVPPGADWQNLFDENARDAPAPEPPTPLVEEKAKDILWSCLNKLQRKDLFCVNHFIVTGCTTGMTYRIVPGMQGNIYREDGARYCVTNSSLPSWDLLLAQKLMLEDDERKFLALARRLDLDEVADQPELDNTVEAMTQAVLGDPRRTTFDAGEISPDLRPRQGRSLGQILLDSVGLNRPGARR